MSFELQNVVGALSCDAPFWTLRYVGERSEEIAVRNGVVQPMVRKTDRGAMLTVVRPGGMGYAATCDLSRNGLQAALDRADAWAWKTSGLGVFDYSRFAYPSPEGRYASPGLDLTMPALAERIDLLRVEDAAAACDARVVDRSASIQVIESEQVYWTNQGGTVRQSFRFVIPNLQVTAHAEGETQTRSLGGQYNGYCQQGGSEVIERSGLVGSGRRVAQEALELLTAPNCPGGRMDVLLMPDQMMLQIHESIGHPLELDRILGDERNFAGTSFVTPDMFGNYRYGSDLLNVTYDPGHHEQLASYAYDDEGMRAEKQFIIRNGLLERPLGGQLSLARAGFSAGVANTRAAGWNRAPIDRMANLNVEPGTSTLDEMIAAVEHGVLMKTNVSWSIDDSRNKFQFGCEWGQLIRNGRLAGVVKNPNYRGISANFWRNLKRVGDRSTFEVMGTPYCGKGEPSQVIRVGHASPACLFADVEVFGGEQ